MYKYFNESLKSHCEEIHSAVECLLSDTTAAAAKSLQSCPTLCDPRDGSPPGSSIPGILQARTLEWVAISFSNAWKWKLKAKSLSHVRLFGTPWTAAYQAPPSVGFFQARVLEWGGIALSDLFLQTQGNLGAGTQIFCNPSTWYSLTDTWGTNKNHFLNCVLQKSTFLSIVPWAYSNQHDEQGFIWS